MKFMDSSGPLPLGLGHRRRSQIDSCENRRFRGAILFSPYFWPLTIVNSDGHFVIPSVDSRNCLPLRVPATDQRYSNCAWPTGRWPIYLCLRRPSGRHGQTHYANPGYPRRPCSCCCRMIGRTPGTITFALAPAWSARMRACEYHDCRSAGNLAVS